MMFTIERRRTDFEDHPWRKYTVFFSEIQQEVDDYITNTVIPDAADNWEFRSVQIYEDQRVPRRPLI